MNTIFILAIYVFTGDLREGWCRRNQVLHLSNGAALFSILFFFFFFLHRSVAHWFDLKKEAIAGWHTYTHRYI